MTARTLQLTVDVPADPGTVFEAMNMAVMAIGCRSDSLRSAAIAAAQRIGKVKVDHGDTACKTPDAVAAIEKAWAHSNSKGFESPAAQDTKLQRKPAG